MAAEQFTQVLKAPYLHVPYKGGAPSNAAVAGGEVGPLDGLGARPERCTPGEHDQGDDGRRGAAHCA